MKPPFSPFMQGVSQPWIMSSFLCYFAYRVNAPFKSPVLCSEWVQFLFSIRCTCSLVTIWHAVLHAPKNIYHNNSRWVKFAVTRTVWHEMAEIWWRLFASFSRLFLSRPPGAVGNVICKYFESEKRHWLDILCKICCSLPSRVVCTFPLPSISQSLSTN